MAAQPTREHLIRQGRRFKKAQAAILAVERIFRGGKKRAQRQEVFIDAASGKVRTLWYGFENTETAPVFFDLHGGGFLLGSPEMDHDINLEFNQAVGCKVISIDYAKAPEHPYPAAVDQVYAVVQHVFEHADRYGIDAGKMAIGGHSAGANLSTVACMKAVKDGKFRFACQLLDYPPLDLATSPYDKPQPEGCILPSMAQIFDACYIDPAEAKDPYASPVYAGPDDLAGLPPALIIVAGRDSLHDEGLKYAEMLTAAGVDVEIHDYPEAAHGFTLGESGEAMDARGKMVRFLSRWLG